MTDIDDRVLERVRKLLTRAEHPTTPPAEAEACSAKAAELMSRHLIDQAMLDARGLEREAPVVRRIVVESPYSITKCLLLSNVAGAFGVPTAIYRGTQAAPSQCTLVGFPRDVATVELLFTSLLLQASTAMRIASVGQPRVKAFRRSFLFGYAATIGRRLAEVRGDAVAEAESVSPGTDLVLADRQAVVDTAFKDEFPRLATLKATSSSGNGLVAGRNAGARADLSTQGRVSNRRGEISA